MKKIFLTLCAAGAALAAMAAGWQYNGVGGLNAGFGQGPIAYGRNLQISTTNDSVGLVIQKPFGTNATPSNTNDIEEAYDGSVLMWGINSNGAPYGIGSNGVTQAQANFGFQAGTSRSNVITFVQSFLAGTTPVVTFVSTNTNVVYSLTSVSATSFTVSPAFAGASQAPSNTLYYQAIGIPSTVTH